MWQTLCMIGQVCQIKKGNVCILGGGGGPWLSRGCPGFTMAGVSPTPFSLLHPLLHGILRSLEDPHLSLLASRSVPCEDYIKIWVCEKWGGVGAEGEICICKTVKVRSRLMGCIRHPFRKRIIYVRMSTFWNWTSVCIVSRVYVLLKKMTVANGMERDCNLTD